MSGNVSFQRPDGKECTGFFVAPPSGESAPGIVVIQEWWGLNSQIEGVAQQLAAQGYCALVPDLYRGTVTLDAAEAAHLMSTLDFLDAASQDIRGAVHHLQQQSTKVAVVGFCMGGALAILAAVLAPEADAVVSWYGVPPAEAADTRTIRMPVQGHFAQQDDFFPPAQVDALEARLTEANVDHELHRYDARHAFGNETGPNYDAAATSLAWERTVRFLDQHLR